MSYWKQTGIVTAGAAAALLLGSAQLPAVGAAGSGASELFDPAYIAASICRTRPGKAGSPFRPIARPVAFQRSVPQVAARSDTAAPPLFEGLGQRSIAITTNSPLAQRYFDQGLRFNYAFNHAEALRAFREAQRLDPDCALCYWGEALSLGPNINMPMDPRANEPALNAIGKALARAGFASEKERALIAALSERYAPGDKLSRGELDAAYADAMAAVAAQFPEDQEIAVLYAEAVMDLSPWNYWEADKKTPKGRNGEVIAILERVLAANPDHPAAIHLYIHMMEASATPEKAEPFADRLGPLMPAAGHLVHMPSHIYYRIGRYIDSLNANLAAVEADEAYLAQVEASGIYPYGYYPHNIHFVVTSAQMAGAGEIAVQQSEKLAGKLDPAFTKQAPWVQAIMAAPYFAHAQFSAPETILALETPPKDFPYVRGLWHYARAIAYLQQGEAAKARSEAEVIRALGRDEDLQRLMQGGLPAQDVLEIAVRVIGAKADLAAGDHAAARTGFEEAVAVQDGLPYMEPPFWYYPVRQSLGAALMEAGEAGEAEAVFKQALIDSPNNAYALFGLKEAQKAQGDQAGAAATGKLFDKAWAGAGDGPTLSQL